MKTLFTTTVFLIGWHTLMMAQVGIGTTDPQATLDVRNPSSTPAASSGIALPQVSGLVAGSIDGNRPGQIVYNTTDNSIYYFNGTDWVKPSGTDTSIYTTSGTLSGTRYVTQNNFDLNFDNGTLFIDGSANRLGIGTTAPSAQLHTTDGVRFANYANASYLSTDLYGNLQANAGSFWSTTGNSNTNYSSFLGTTNSIPVFFRVNNQPSGQLSTSNTSFGYTSLQVNTGYSNAAFGVGALRSNTSGFRNVAIGHGSMISNISGFYNVSVGAESLESLQSGIGNTAVGENSMESAVSGQGNTAIGLQALRWQASGDLNTAIGQNAFVGNFGGPYYSSSTAIGANTWISASDQIRLGYHSVTSIGGYANWTNLSDGRYKTNIKDNVPGLAFIRRLKPVTYNLNMEALDKRFPISNENRNIASEKLKGTQVQTGFIAQDVEQTAKDLGFDFSGVDQPKNENDTYGLRYAEFVVPLVKAVQELEAKVIELENKIKLLNK